MLRVIIIDDESLVRVGLRSMLQWEKLGYEIVGEAPNGRLGLDLIIKDKPDIVITDIKMPVLDGLEMMRLASQAGQHPAFIVLSSYDEFQLVKQAMKQGAEEYLIKLDLEPETLIDTLAMVREKLAAARGRSRGEEQLEKQLRENIQLFRESFFRQIISKPVKTRSELAEQSRCLDIELDDLLTCALIRVSDMSVFEKYEDDETLSFEASVQNMINEIINDGFKGYTFAWNHGEFVAIFSSDSDEAAPAYRKRVADMCERLVQMLKQYFDVSVSIGISNPRCEYSELAPAYFEACRAAQQSHYRGEEAVLFFAEVPPTDEAQDQPDTTELRNTLSKAIELHDVEMIGTAFERAISILNEPQVSRKQAYDLCFEIAYSISGAAALREAQLREIIGYRNLHESILALDTLTEITNWLIGLEQRLCRLIAQSDEQRNHRLIVRAKRYILEHCTERISLEQVATAVNISPSYLSTVFRQSTGICFTDYVTSTKIGLAKKLLRETDYKIYEISDMLGYQNAYYFSKVFKKIVGMTPSEYSGKVL